MVKLILPNSAPPGQESQKDSKIVPRTWSPRACAREVTKSDREVMKSNREAMKSDREVTKALVFCAR